jgi:serine/threonine protein kinase/tetratricopeptide (TPR) repeat protein
MPEPTDSGKPALPRELTGRIGKYEIVRPIGKGAMGQVYLAHDTVLERDVAFKVMAAQIADDPELKKRFEREAKAVAKMGTHPNVTAVFDLGSLADGSPYIAMELLKGQDLQKAVRQTPPLSLERKVAIIVQVLAGLAHAHALGIIHRDIKPANIFILEDGSVKIMDFGVARSTAASMTGTGNIVGTADYMSPEQVKGAPVDGRSDLFSVGCMLFEIVTSRRPFHSDNLMAIFYKITHDEPNFDQVPQGADHDALLPVLKKALAKDVDQRYQSAFEFAVDLREWLKTHATTTSSRTVLESLVDLEAPTSPPLPVTTAGGFTFTQGEAARPTIDTDRRSTVLPRRPPTGRTSARPPADLTAPTMRPGATRVVPPPSPRRQPRPARRSVLPWVGAGVALVAALGVGAWLLWKSQQTPAPSSPVAAVSVPPATAAPVPTSTPTAPPTVAPTPAPAPTLAQAAGKAAAQIRAAQAAFKDGSYDRAVTAAQQALREDPSSAAAQEVLDRALAGQRALVSLRAAETALARGDFAGAAAGVEAARRAAPWERGVSDLSARIEAARVAAQQAAADAERRGHAAKVVDLLNQANNAAAQKQFDAAIALFDRALELDPANAAAQAGKTLAIGNKTAAEAASRPSSPTRAFVAGATQARGREATAGGPAGFEDSAGVTVRKATQAAALPGRILFEPEPPAPKPGERYRIAVFLRNDGQQPIQLAQALVTTTVDGRRASGPVELSAATVAPGDRALVFQTPGTEVWKDGTSSWTMEIVIRTRAGDSYSSTLAWR